MRLPPIIRRLLGMPSAARQEDGPAPSPAAAGAFHQAPHSRRGPLGWRIFVGLAVGLIFLSGVIQVIVRPIANAVADPPPPPAPVQTMDTAAAASVAVGFTADYWSYSSHDPATRALALARWTGGDQLDSIDGEGQLRTDLVTAGAVATHGADVAVVQTRARVTPATLVGDEPARPKPDGQDRPPLAADPGPADGQTWAAGRPLWLTLDVAVVRTEDDELVATGATLSGDDPAVIARPTTEVDTRLTGQTGSDGLPEDVFAAYAAGDGGQLSYLTTPDVQLDGLSAAVELADVAGWSMATDRAAPGGHRYATAEVTWQLTGTQLHIAQPYALTIADTDGRWLLGAIGPRIEE